MALDSNDFVVTREIAMRTGDIAFKYRTKDGRFIVDSRTLSKIKFSTEEILHGLQGVEKITPEEATVLIAQGGYKMGDSEESTIPEGAAIEEEKEEAKEEESVVSTVKRALTKKKK